MHQKLEKARRALQHGDLEEAAVWAREAAQPEMLPEAVHILASIALAQNKPATAIALIGRTLQLHPRTPPALNGRLHQTLGRALLAEGHLEAARAASTIAVTLLPQEAAAHGGLGEALSALGRFAEATGSFKQALRFAPHQPMLWFLLGQAAHLGGDTAEAARAFGEVARLCPNDPAALANYGGVLTDRGEWEKAAALLERADALAPEQPRTLNNLALARLRLGDVGEACRLFAHACALAPREPALRLNYGTALYERGAHDEAEVLYEALEKEALGSSEAQQAAFNRAAIYLGRGDWAKGWKAFEARHALNARLMNDPVPQALRSLPVWDGTIGDVPVAVYAEQGLGDMVQFLRFLPEAAARRPLKLFLPEGANALASRLENLPPQRLLSAQESAAARVSLLSLPYVLGNLAPEPTPYLRSQQLSQLKGGEAEKTTFVKDERVVGLCWSGNASYIFDRRRSLPLKALVSLNDTPGVRFRALQPLKASEKQLAAWLEKPSLASLSDLAREVESCDLVVSVDTLAAHMAGALGRPLWLLNRRGGDWRWEENRWYRDVRQFVPPREGLPEETWGDAISALREALVSWAAQRMGG